MERFTLARAAQLVGALCRNRNAEGSIPGWGAYLGCRFDPWSRRVRLSVQTHTTLGAGVYETQLIGASLSHQCFFLSLLLSKINGKKVERFHIKNKCSNRTSHLSGKWKSHIHSHGTESPGAEWQLPQPGWTPQVCCRPPPAPSACSHIV